MPTLDDVRQICARFPGATEGAGEQFGFGVVVKGKHKGFAWSWRERVHPKKPKVINDQVLAIRVPNLEAKEALLATRPEICFTEPHYNGYPAILVWLEKISVEELEDLLLEGWRSIAG